ncbi:hypothetical protein PSTG_14675 [Puccinia striiformis f. sp. tritici PST-78]|uniref:Uncharacterized protein n=1 Tax=Puccinia striiformis f. sp. tritici PST-78 TaxID=1165861 RepID=A0A0L0UYC6_9BASI|nr:hypothetical protein PSTG_14675 [Puccinia striiformis f. sp. tritici PST-78]
MYHKDARKNRRAFQTNKSIKDKFKHLYQTKKLTGDPTHKDFIRDAKATFQEMCNCPSTYENIDEDMNENDKEYKSDDERNGVGADVTIEWPCRWGTAKCTIHWHMSPGQLTSHGFTQPRRWTAARKITLLRSFGAPPQRPSGGSMPTNKSAGWRPRLGCILGAKRAPMMSLGRLHANQHMVIMTLPSPILLGSLVRLFDNPRQTSSLDFPAMILLEYYSQFKLSKEKELQPYKSQFARPQAPRLSIFE